MSGCPPNLKWEVMLVSAAAHKAAQGTSMRCKMPRCQLNCIRYRMCCGVLRLFFPWRFVRCDSLAPRLGLRDATWLSRLQAVCLMDQVAMCCCHVLSWFVCIWLTQP